MSDPKREHTLAVLCMLGAMLCYSAVPIFIRYFTGYLDRWCVNAVRYSVGALFWLPFVLLWHTRSRAQPPPEPRRNVWRDALVPATLNLMGQVGYGASPYYVTAPTIGFVLRMSFLFTILLGFLFIPEERRLAGSRFFLCGAVACVGGVVALFVEGLRGEGDQSLVGMLILLGTTVCWAGYVVSVRRWLAGYPVRLSFGVISLYTTGGLIALMLLLGDVGAFGRLPARVWLLLVLSGFVGITFSHVMYYRGIHTLGPVVATGTTMAAPFFTYLGASLLLDETLTRLQLGGGALVVAGGFCLVVAKGRLVRATPPSPAAPRA